MTRRWYPPGVPKVEADHQRGRGHRKAPPRASGATDDHPAHPRPHPSDRGPAGDEQAPAPRTGRRSAIFLRLAWVLAFLGLTAGLVVLQVQDGPALARQSLAAALGTILSLGLAVRSGAHAPLATAFGLTLGVGAVATQWDPLLAGAAVGTAVVAACLAVLGTRPAPNLPAVALEVVIALVVAAAGGLAAAGFTVDVDTERFVYTVLSLAVVAISALVYRLGGGLHGLGRRGLVLAAGSLVLLVVVLVYTAALTKYGSPELIRQVRSAQDWAHDHLGGVPHPVEVLIGIPGLAWGVSMRSRRRQGWWACAFGVAATAHLASDLLHAGDTVRASALSAVYGLVLGLVLGAVLIRLERALTGRGERRRRSRRGSPPMLRREPSRLRPLH